MSVARRADALTGIAWVVLVALGVVAVAGPDWMTPPLVASDVVVAVALLASVTVLTAVTAGRGRGSLSANVDLPITAAIVLLPVAWTGPLLAVSALAWWRPGRTRGALQRGAIRGGVATACALLALAVTRPAIQPSARPVLALSVAQTVLLFAVGVAVAALVRIGGELLERAAGIRPGPQMTAFVVTTVIAAGVLVPATVAVADDPAIVVLGFVAVTAISYGWTVLLQAAETQTEQQTQLLRSSLTAGDDARLAMAGRIHDGPVQTLAAALLLTDPGGGPIDPELEQVREYIRAAEQELRVISTAAGPGPEIFDIASSLEPIADDDDEGPLLDFSVPDELPREAARVAWPILDEAVRNAVSHADPQHVHVTVVSRDDGSLLAWVVDDGTGFDVRAAAPTGHLGLALMNERARSAGGRISLISSEQEGTCVHLHVPGTEPEEPIRPSPPWICVLCLDEWRGRFAR